MPGGSRFKRDKVLKVLRGIASVLKEKGVWRKQPKFKALSQVTDGDDSCERERGNRSERVTSDT